MLTVICISVVAIVVALLTVALIRSRRAIAKSVSDSTRHRSVLDDCGDDVIWEVGKMRPIGATREFQEQLSKRSFLKRAAFTVSAFSVAWLASSDKSVANCSELHSAEDHLAGNEDSIKADRLLWPERSIWLRSAISISFAPAGSAR